MTESSSAPPPSAKAGAGADAPSDAPTDAPSDAIDGPLLKLILVLLVGGIMGLLDTSIVNVGIDTLGRDLDAPLKSVEWVTTAYLLSLSAAVPFSGWALDRFGGKQIWLTGLVVFMVGSVLCATAWNVGSLIGFRVLQGIGAGMLEPTVMTLLARAAGPARAGKTIGILGVTITLGPILGPVLGGVILGNFDWRWMFLINIPIGLLALVLAVRVVPTDLPPDGEPAKLDLIGILLLCPGFVAVIYALSQASGGVGFGAARVIVGLVVGVLLLAAYVPYALRATEPLLNIRLFVNRGFSGGVASVFLNAFLLFSLLLLVPLYYQVLRGRGVMAAGLLLVPQGLGGWVSMPISGLLFDKIGARVVIPVGGVLTAIGLSGFALFGAHASIGLLIGASVVTGLGLGAIAAPAMSSAFGSVPPASVPSATAAVYLGNQIGGSLGIAVAALVFQNLGQSHSVLSSFQGTFAFLIPVAILVGVAGLTMPRLSAARAATAQAAAAPVPEPAPAAGQ
jgi:EmrB/QacA subfamily drug resistance transporter